jgi:hypothetical protein
MAHAGVQPLQAGAGATVGAREIGRGRGEFAVDAWSLELLRVEPDSTTLAAIAEASGGRTTIAAAAARWASGIETRALTRRRTTSSRLWESPWLFALIVLTLAGEWIWRRRRGLP